MACSLKRATSYIKKHPTTEKVLGNFVDIVKNIWSLINSIYESKWDLLIFDREKRLSLNKCITNYFVIRSNDDINNKSTKESSPSSQNPNPMPKIIPLPSVMLLSLAIPSSDNKVNFINKKAPKPSNIKKSYVQTLKANILPNVEDILQIKEVFPTLSANKVTKMIKAKNSSKGQKKPKISMITKEPSRKQIIIPMAKLNAKLIINSAN